MYKLGIGGGPMMSRRGKGRGGKVVIPLIASLDKNSFPYSSPTLKTILDMGRDTKRKEVEVESLDFQELVVELNGKILLELAKQTGTVEKFEQVISYCALALGGGMLNKTKSITVTTSAARLLDESSGHRFVKIFNADSAGTNILYISPNSTVTTGQGFPINPGDTPFGTVVKEGQTIYGVGDGTIDVRIAELSLPYDF